MPQTEWRVNPGDLRVLRERAERVAEIAASTVNEERRRRWLDHNALRGGGPMLLAETGGLAANGEFTLDPLLLCREPWARDVERGLLGVIVHHETVRDDTVVEPVWNVGWRVSTGDYGVSSRRRSGSREGHLGSYAWDPPIQSMERDFEKLHPRIFSVDREGTLHWKEHLDSVFDGRLTVRIRGGFWWTMGMTWAAIDLIGLEALMLWMIDDPDGIHRLMAFLRDDHIAFARWLEREGLLTPNNENDYVGSGSLGYSTEIGPSHDGATRLSDLWVLSESQETVGVSASMFAEFIFPYQLEVAREFGLVYYGCCEPVHGRWEVIRRLPNLRKVSVSPWCDEARMAEACGRKVIYCRKPNPALVSTGRFDEEAIREDLRGTLRAARDCHVEIVMKDVHTVAGDSTRLPRWVEIAREECALTGKQGSGARG